MPSPTSNVKRSAHRRETATPWAARSSESAGKCDGSGSSNETDCIGGLVPRSTFATERGDGVGVDSPSGLASSLPPAPRSVTRDSSRSSATRTLTIDVARVARVAMRSTPLTAPPTRATELARLTEAKALPSRCSSNDAPSREASKSSSSSSSSPSSSSSWSSSSSIAQSTSGSSPSGVELSSHRNGVPGATASSRAHAASHSRPQSMCSGTRSRRIGPRFHSLEPADAARGSSSSPSSAAPMAHESQPDPHPDGRATTRIVTSRRYSQHSVVPSKLGGKPTGRSP
jgi:hypothetical protein